MRTPSNSPTRRLARRSGLAAFAVIAVLGTGLATAAAASAADQGGPGNAVFQVLDPVLDPLLAPAPEDPANAGDDPSELNLECAPDTGTCHRVPGPGQENSTTVTTAPAEKPTAATKGHPRRG